MENELIAKPWGHEYCAYRNEHVAVWVMEISRDAQTSLHAHPRKSTAFVVLRGMIEMHLLRGTPIVMRTLDKINMFRGRFHRQRARTDCVALLEIEAPDIKDDIVRLEDDYGRTGQPIEMPTAPLPAGALVLSEPVPFNSVFAERELILFTRGNLSLSRTMLQGVFVALRGGFENGLLAPGEAIDGASLLRLAYRFSLRDDTLLLWVR